MFNKQRYASDSEYAEKIRERARRYYFAHGARRRSEVRALRTPKVRRNFGELLCASCGEIKPCGWFEIKRRYADGSPCRHSYCRDCKLSVDSQRHARRRAAGVPICTDKLAVKRLLASQLHRCARCLCELRRDSFGKVNYHLDHKIPVSKGGRHEEGNLQLLCIHCNLTKSAKLAA